MAHFCYVLFAGLTTVSVNKSVSACKVRAVKLDPGVEDGERVVFFPPLIGFSEYTAQDTSTDALGGGGCRGRSGFMEVPEKTTWARSFCGRLSGNFFETDVWIREW